jgi:hypothetical protein
VNAATQEAVQIIAAADPGEPRAYYAALQTSENPRELVEAMLPELDRILDVARAQRDRLLRTLREAEQRVSQLERLEAVSRAIRDDVDAPLAVGLTGRQIALTALDVAHAHGRTELHYRDWYELFRQAGHLIDSADPEAVFLTAISRFPGIAAAGARSGVYRVSVIQAEDGDE